MAIDSATLSAASALAGSAIGGLASFATTWLTQHYQSSSQRHSQESSRREKLFGNFIDEASRLYADAISQSLEGPSKLVPLYAVVGKLRLFASRATIDSADAVVAKVIDTYYQPNPDFHSREAVGGHAFDLLRNFAQVCRMELRG